MNYEKTLTWLAQINNRLEDANFRKWDDDRLTAYNKAMSQVHTVAHLLGSQSPLWTPAAARLSGDSSDLVAFELRRASAKLRIPEACRELNNLVLDALLSSDGIPSDLELED